MSLLNQVHRGRQQRAPRMLLYGTEGIGKSTTAAGAPKPVFIPTEDGLGEIDCVAFPLAGTYEQVIAALTALVTDAHDFETVVIDSLDWLERLVFDRLCRDWSVNSIEKVDGGYGKGYTHALAYWRELLGLLDRLRLQRNMVVILLAHAKVERFEDPESSSYDRYAPRLHKLAAALVGEWCDAVLFATRKLRTRSEDAGFGRKRTTALPVGAAGGERVLRCVGGPACVAKNRYSLPEELPLSFAALVQAMSAASQSQGV